MISYNDIICTLISNCEYSKFIYTIFQLYKFPKMTPVYHGNCTGIDFRELLVFTLIYYSSFVSN